MKCKINNCDKLCNDVVNSGGHATKHLRDVHNILDENYMQYYDVIDRPVKEKFHCPIKNCDWTSNDLDNKSGWFTTHINKIHNLEVDQFCELFPDYKKYWIKYFKEHDRQEFINSNENNKIICQICGKAFKKITNKHLSRPDHNTTPENISKNIMNY